MDHRGEHATSLTRPVRFVITTVARNRRTARIGEHQRILGEEYGQDGLVCCGARIECPAIEPRVVIHGVNDVIALVVPEVVVSCWTNRTDRRE